MARLRQLGTLQPTVAKATLCTTPRSRVIAHSRPPPSTPAPGREPPSQSPNFRRRRREMTQAQRRGWGPEPRVGPRAKCSSESSVSRMSVRTRGLGGSLGVRAQEAAAGTSGAGDFRGGAPRRWSAGRGLRGGRASRLSPACAPGNRSGAVVGAGRSARWASGPQPPAPGQPPRVPRLSRGAGYTQGQPGTRMGWFTRPLLSWPERHWGPQVKRGGCSRGRKGRGVSSHPTPPPWSPHVGGKARCPHLHLGAVTRGMSRT